MSVWGTCAMAFTLRVLIIVEVSDNASNSTNETTAQVNNSARLEAGLLQD